MADAPEMIREIAQSIWSALGPGYSERVYHNALEVSLRKRGVPYESERIIPVLYDGHVIGNVRSDLIIDNKIVIEVKAVSRLTEQFRIQIQKYMELTGCKQGYLINFPTDKSIVDIEYIA
jgi:GxxExxY protein